MSFSDYVEYHQAADIVDSDGFFLPPGLKEADDDYYPDDVSDEYLRCERDNTAEPVADESPCDAFSCRLQTGRDQKTIEDLLRSKAQLEAKLYELEEENRDLSASSKLDACTIQDLKQKVKREELQTKYFRQELQNAQIKLQAQTRIASSKAQQAENAALSKQLAEAKNKLAVLEAKCQAHEDQERLLQSTIEQKEKDIAEISEKSEETTKILAEVRRVARKYKTLYDELLPKFEELQGQHAQLSNSNAEFAATKSRLDVQLAEAVSKAAKFEAVAFDLKGSVTALQEKADTQSREQEALKRERLTEQAGFRQQLDSANSIIAVLTNAKGQIEQQLTETLKNVERLEKESQERETKLRQSEETLAANRILLSDKNQELQALAKHVEELQESFNHVARSEMFLIRDFKPQSQALALLTAEKEQLTKQLEDASVKLAEAVVAKLSLEDAHATTMSDLQRLKTELFERLQFVKSEESNASKAKHAAMVGELEKLKDELASKACENERQLAAEQLTSADLRRRLDRLQADNNVMKELVNQHYENKLALERKVATQAAEMLKLKKESAKIPGMECSICLDDMPTGDGARCALVPCGHIFCTPCIEGHERKRRAEVKPELRTPDCPVCRAKFHGVHLPSAVFKSLKADAGDKLRRGLLPLFTKT